ncbi:MAG: hypothetical protein J3R72DRAFT_528613 [Linnemannia gamsii]|nr:MAG: hypothetical protein J3R72DRAFT_528613 [Linnemannia gamsii]
MPSPALDAMVVAFSQTLKYLQVENLQGADHAETIGFGRGWTDLPVLSQLQLRAPRHRLALDSLLLTQSPSIMFVTLKDETFEHSGKDAAQWLPAQLPNIVKELNANYGLEGRDRGEDMGENVDKFLALPDAIVRPIWTWEWDLPSLASLTLTSEFACRFQFKMLQGCQALEMLHLHMRTVEGDHTQVITKADLFVSGADGSQDRIVAPKLQ